MPRPGADRIVTQKHRRAFSQRGGPRPDFPVRYAGSNEAYMVIDDDDNPVRGGITPIYIHAAQRRGAFDLIGSSQEAPDFPTASISFMHNHGGVPWVDYDLTCYNNFYEYVGSPCKTPSDKINGWTDYVKIYSYGQGNGRSDTGNTTQDSDDASMTQVEFAFQSIYKIGALNFGTVAAVEVEREVVDVAYGSIINCGSCGPADDGTKRIYAVTRSSGAGSPGTPAEVVYTTDGGLTWANTNITGLGGTVDPTGIDVVGNYVVVLDTSGNGYWYAELNTLTGVPGTWINVTAGFVAAKQPNDLYVVSPNEIYFCGEGGYIYKSTDIPSGVTVINAGSATTTDLVRIHGYGDTIVAAGESGTIVRSLNRGATFATTTTTPTTATVRALLVLDDYRIWIGTSGGLVYYTINGGETWVLQSLPGGTLAIIDDIVAATDEVIHIAARTATPTGRLLTTWNGGEGWASSATTTQRIQSLPTANRFNRIAVPRDVDATTASNNIVLGGLSGGGVDGILTLGVANKV